jgi:hypothetical protein
MKLIKGTGPARARRLMLFMVLLCVSYAAPVLAESPKMGVGPARVAEAPARAVEVPTAPEVEEAAPPPTEMQPPVQAPIAEEVEVVESEEAAREEWLKGPEAIRQREESRTAFDELSAADAEGVMGSVFEEALKQKLKIPAGFWGLVVLLSMV